jgi:hypothetical protein
VAVGAHEGVGVGPALLRVHVHDLRQVLEVDLVADAGARRHHPKATKGLLAPLEELVALAVALHLEVDVAAEGLR